MSKEGSIGLRRVTDNEELQRLFKLLSDELGRGCIERQWTPTYRNTKEEQRQHVAQRTWWNRKHKFWWRPWSPVLGASFGDEHSFDGNRSQPAVFEANAGPRGYLGFAKDEGENIYVVHTCRMGGGAKGVNRGTIMQSLKKQGIRFERVNWSPGKLTEAAVIASLGSSTLQEDCAKFIGAVRVAKNKPSKWQVFERDRFQCRYCRYDGSLFEAWLNLEVDHLKPRKCGGTNQDSNLVTACKSCNAIKGSRTFDSVEKAREFINRRRETLRQYRSEMKGTDK